MRGTVLVFAILLVGYVCIAQQDEDQAAYVEALANSGMVAAESANENAEPVAVKEGETIQEAVAADVAARLDANGVNPQGQGPV